MNNHEKNNNTIPGYVIPADFMSAEYCDGCSLYG